MKAPGFAELSVTVDHFTWCYIPEDCMFKAEQNVCGSFKVVGQKLIQQHVGSWTETLLYFGCKLEMFTWC
jgi:hypothetical protein